MGVAPLDTRVRLQEEHGGRGRLGRAEAMGAASAAAAAEVELDTRVRL